MNKKLIALAVAAAAAPAVHAADNEVILYGQVNLGFEVSSPNNGPDQLKISDLASRIGFKGTEDLGGGMKAFFKVETGIGPDNARVSGFGSREAWVGVQGNFGKVGLGRGKSPYTNATEEFDPFYMEYSNALNWNGPHTYRINNSVRYDFSNDNITFSLQNGFGENKTATQHATNEFSTQLKYTMGSVFVIGAYNDIKPQAGSHLKNGLLGVGATIGDLFLGGAWQYRKDGQSYDDGTFVASYALDKLTLQGAVIAWDDDTGGKDKGKTQYNLGVNYNLSKRTVITTEYTGNHAGAKDNNIFTLAINHSF